MDSYESLLREHWQTLFEPYKVSDALVDEKWVTVWNGWSEPHRHYHTPEHLANLIASIESQDWSGMVHSILTFTAFYHDVIYDPLATDNEAQSATLAENELLELGIHTAVCDAVPDLIYRTANHMDAVDFEPEYASWFLDADLQILGSEPAAYARYAQQVRSEYSVIPEKEYCGGRIGVLERFLEADAIYRTDSFREQYETQARKNLLSEIDQLKAKLLQINGN